MDKGRYKKGKFVVLSLPWNWQDTSSLVSVSLSTHTVRFSDFMLANTLFNLMLLSACWLKSSSQSLTCHMIIWNILGISNTLNSCSSAVPPWFYDELFNYRSYLQPSTITTNTTTHTHTHTHTASCTSCLRTFSHLVSLPEILSQAHPNECRFFLS